MTIVKVQIPLSWAGRPPTGCLVYAEGRNRVTEQNVPSAVITALRGDAKGYFQAMWRDNKWAIGRRVEDRDW